MFGWMSARSGTERHGAHAARDAAQSETGLETGLISGTRVATAMGWRPVEAIAEGDHVLTFDTGLQPVRKIVRVRLWAEGPACPRALWPLEVPAGKLGNRDLMRVLPGQSVMIESDAAEDLYGDPFSLVPALAIEGTNGVDRVPPHEDAEVIVLHFDADQVVFANNGALFLCPACYDLLQTATIPETVRPTYATLSMDEARFLAVHLEEETTARPAEAAPATWAASAMA